MSWEHVEMMIESRRFLLVNRVCWYIAHWATSIILWLILHNQKVMGLEHDGEWMMTIVSIVIIYSPSCHSKPLFISLFMNHWCILTGQVWICKGQNDSTKKCSIIGIEFIIVVWIIIIIVFTVYHFHLMLMVLYFHKHLIIKKLESQWW